MIPRLRDYVLGRLARLLIRSGTFRRHLGDLDANLDPRFLRAVSLLRNATNDEALFLRDLVNGTVPDIPLWVLHETRWKTGGYFVEFGAADGVILSNTYLLEKEYAWKGIVVEPNPHYHLALMRNRDVEIDLRCVFTTTGERIRFAVTKSPLLSTIVDYADQDGHALSRQEHEILKVETVSLNDLLELHQAPCAIDFISIDTEGSEFDILSHFDFRRWDVTLFAIEHNSHRQRVIDELMRENGYQPRYVGYPLIDSWYRKMVNG